MKHKWEIYTDGSTKANGQENAVGAWAYLILCDGVVFDQRARGVRQTTNQRMELQAALNALIDNMGYLERNDEIIIYSDSAYLINCQKAKWWENWQKNGWKNSKKENVANRDLWQELIPFFQCSWIKWEKVKGHDTNIYNNIVDGLAQSAAEELRNEINSR